jgi:hypothetical protein
MSTLPIRPMNGYTISDKFSMFVIVTQAELKPSTEEAYELPNILLKVLSSGGWHAVA